MDGIPDGIYIDTPENRELIRKGLGLYPDYRNWRDDFDPSFVAELDVMQYADKQELEESIIRRHYGTIVMDSEQPQGGGTSAGGMAQGIQAAPDSRKTVFRP